MRFGKNNVSSSDIELLALNQRDELQVEEYNAHTQQHPLINSSDEVNSQATPRWKVAIRYCALAVSAVFLMNTIFLIVGEGRVGFPAFNSNDGKRVLYDGQCDTTKKINVGVHLLINILSTILLGASNYCMQCMSAPTRADAERAHAQFTWVDIGVPSIRNLRKINRLRASLWLMLGISSLPLHLFYNSTVYASITASEYMIFSVNDNFLDTSIKNFTRNDMSTNQVNVIHHMFNLHREGKLERLDKSDCLSAYAQSFQSARGNVLLVVSNSTQGFTEGAFADYEDQEAPMTSLDDSNPDPFSWICKQYTTRPGSCLSYLSEVRSDIGDWRPFSKQVEYCMSEKVDQHCRLEYSAYLLLLVALIGLVKTAVMVFIIFKIQDTPLLTIGDAVSSFLTVPEPRTKGMCLLDKSLKHFEPSIRYAERAESGEYTSVGWTAPPKYFHPGRKRHFTAASTRRWLAFLITFAILIGVAIFLLQYGIYWFKGTDTDARQLYTQGLGTIDPRTFISWDLPTSGATGLISNVVVANIPQLLLSFLYLNYNGLMTAMSLAHEASRYGIRRNGLRVSSTPRGAQRSTYFLQLPYRFSLPIMLVTAVLHWLISQSIFLVSIEAIMLIPSTGTTLYSPLIWDTTNPRTLMTCGYAPSAILAVIVLTSLLLIGMLGTGVTRLPSSMPVAASCSAAIAAACHVAEGEREEACALKEVMWGDTGSDEKGVGHCAFSTRDVEVPEEGRLHA